MNGTTLNSTHVPILCYDEGQGDPASYNANPQHASFATTDEPHCYPQSKVNSLYSKTVVSMSKECWNTDKIEEFLCCVIPVYFSFKEDYEATDEVSTSTVAALLEMQKEATDRQGYPIFNNANLAGDNVAMGTAQLGLTTDDAIEGITFDIDALYNALHYYSNAGKLRTCMGKPIFKRVRRGKSATFNLSYKMNPKVKRLNEYTYCGRIITIFNAASDIQLCQASDDTAVTHAVVSTLDRFAEWNDNFDMNRS